MTTPTLSEDIAAVKAALGIYEADSWSGYMRACHPERMARLVKALEGSQWISVEDRMPDVGTDCHVWVKPPWAKEPHAAISRWDEQHEAPLEWSSATIPIGPGWDDYEFDDVTHWMPVRPPSAPAQAGKEPT